MIIFLLYYVVVQSSLGDFTMRHDPVKLIEVINSDFNLVELADDIPGSEFNGTTSTITHADNDGLTVRRDNGQLDGYEWNEQFTISVNGEEFLEVNT